MILGAEPKNQVIWTIHCKVMAPNLQICPNMGKIDEKRPFLSRPSVNYFKNSLKSFVIMLLTAPGVKLPSYRKNGFKASWWRCVGRLSYIPSKMIFLLYTGTSALIIYISNIQGTNNYSAVMY